MQTISYSALTTFQECKQKYYWNYIRRLELKRFSSSRLVGRCVGFGVTLLLKQDPQAVKKTMEYVKAESQKLRTMLSLAAEQEQELKQQELIIHAMLVAYKDHYNKTFIQKVQVLQPEHRVEYMVTPDLKLLGAMDHLLRYNKKLYLHELKTTKALTPDYVKSIQHDLQTAGYLHAHNLSSKNKIAGIIYNVIRKPSIRQKQTESYPQFLERLHNYYRTTQKSETFHLEVIEKPLITQDMAINTFKNEGLAMAQCKEQVDYTKNFRACNNYGKCEYFNLCFSGENKLTLINFKTKESYAATHNTDKREA